MEPLNLELQSDLLKDGHCKGRYYIVKYGHTSLLYEIYTIKIVFVFYLV